MTKALSIIIGMTLRLEKGFPKREQEQLSHVRVLIFLVVIQLIVLIQIFCHYYPKFTAQEVVNLYLEPGDEIFNIPLKHKIRTAGGVLNEKYPIEELEEAACLKPVILVKFAPGILHIEHKRVYFILLQLNFFYNH